MANYKHGAPSCWLS